MWYIDIIEGDYDFSGATEISSQVKELISDDLSEILSQINSAVEFTGGLSDEITIYNTNGLVLRIVDLLTAEEKTSGEFHPAESINHIEVVSGLENVNLEEEMAKAIA